MDYKEKLKEALNSDNTDYEVVRWIEQNFPELKESEDERIRKQLIEHTKWSYDEQEISEEEKERWISWLEKQGEQKPADKVEPKFKVGDTVKSTFSDIQYYITDVHDYYYTTDTGCVIMFNSQDNFELSEQNHAWSEEDEEYFDDIVRTLRSFVITGGSEAKRYTEEEINWLKSLKDRVQPKQEWGEEDEKLYNDLSDTYFYNDEDYPEETYKLMLKRVLDWMNKRAKSLRPQNRWKPSETDIRLLELIIQGKANPTNYQATLMNLVEQLKKLREK